jgi:hypothetical protein
VGWGGQVAQTMYAHVSKNGKRKKERKMVENNENKIDIL